MKELTDDIEITLKKNRRQEAMRATGWGSIQTHTKLLKLVVIFYRIECLFDVMTIFTFRVIQQHRTLNGNTSHRIEIQPNLTADWQSEQNLRSAILLAVVPGTFTDFQFTLTIDQIKALSRHSVTGGAYVKMTAERVGSSIIIYWKENGRQPIKD